ncbi:MAG: NAD-binding protein, partial [Phycisphaerae bacterium]|nr:NAD-binding protein [Phycisphaerae bacterium]
MSEKLGFIGLGVMGGHMARHLSEVYALTVFDVDPDKVAALDKAEPAASVQQVGRTAEVVLLSLPSSQIVEEVIIGNEGLLSVMKQGGLVIDTSTTEPTVSKKIAARLSDQGIEFMDAPVSGGEGAARGASLAVMAGASPEVFKRGLPYLEVFGKSVVHVGDIGSGGVTKLINNMIVGATFAVIAEGFALGKTNGLDPEVLYKAIKDGWAGSTVLDVAAPGIIERNFTPGGTIDLLFKDIGYALSLARTHNVPVPMTAMSDEIFKAARASGRGGQAQQVII